MATLAAVFSFFTLHMLVLMTNANGNLVMKVHPSQISPGLSSSLDINCSFSSVDHPEMAEFASLILSKANLSGEKFEDMAAVTQFSPDSVNVLTKEKVSATGVYTQSGETFIHLSWQYPTQLQSGVYKCTAYGLDILGECLEVVSTSVVTVEEADLNDIFEILKEMKIHRKAMENKISDMEKHIEALEYNNSEMMHHAAYFNYTILRLEKNIQDLQNNNSQMSSYITDHDQSIAGMEKIFHNNKEQILSYISDLEMSVAGVEKQVKALEYNASLQNSYITNLEETVASLGLKLLGTYQNHDYYISKVPYGKIDVAIIVCNSHRGYLTEIDSRNEFNAMKSFLDLTSGFDFAMIAGTDEAVDGTWILQSNQQPLPFTSWVYSGASTGTSLNCLGLVRDRSWNMDDYECNRDPPENRFRFTCEIPRV